MTFYTDSVALTLQDINVLFADRLSDRDQVVRVSDNMATGDLFTRQKDDVSYEAIVGDIVGRYDRALGELANL